MYDYNSDSFHMENEYDTQARSICHAPEPVNNDIRYYKETIKQRNGKGGFKKFVAVAVICAVIGAPLLGLGMGAGQTIAENYLNLTGSDDAPAEEAATDTEQAELKADSVSTIRTPIGNSPGSIVEVVKASQASVVNITTSVITQDRFFSYYFGGGGRSFESQGSGTGIIFDEDDENVYIMTNYHVIESASKAYISFDNNEQVQASPVGGDKEEDVAVISVKKSDLASEGVTEISIANLGDSSNIEVGEWVVAIGNAIGNGKTVTYGIISGLNKEVSFSDGRKPVNLIQTDAAINQGNSGGALVNMSGEVIGMNTAKLAGYTIEGMGFALPMNSIIEIVEGLMGNKSSEPRPFIGISGSTITEDIAEMRGLTVTEGVMIEDVIEGGGAADAGLRPTDIIIEFDGKKISTIEELVEIIGEKEIGSKVEAKIIRDNSRELEIRIVISNMTDVTPW